MQTFLAQDGWMYWATLYAFELRAAAHKKAFILAQEANGTSTNAWQRAVSSEADRMVRDVERRHQEEIIGILRSQWPHEIEALAMAMTMLPDASYLEIQSLAFHLRELRLVDIERAIARETLCLWRMAIRKLSGAECPWQKPGWNPRTRDQ